MTKKLAELFDLPPIQEAEAIEITGEVGNEVIDDDYPITQATVAKVDDALDKIDRALPAVKKLDQTDTEFDELAELAQTTFSDLMELGMNVEPRHSGRLFEIASSMLGHAITAKTAKMDKKLKMIDLQLRKAKLDHDKGVNDDETEEGRGTTMDRNQLLAHILKGDSAPKV